MRVFKLGSDAGKFEEAVLESVSGATYTPCGCELDTLRDVKVETRSGPCCALDYTYSFSEWTKNCDGLETRSETETCTATGHELSDGSDDDDDGEDGGVEKADAPLDLIYMLDLTGSMGSWLAEAKTKFTAITDALAPKYAHLEDGLRVGFVGYRDASDSVRFVVSPPTSDFDSVLDTIKSQAASGGGDFPEDVAGGFDQVSKLSLRSNATKLLVHIADAPGHAVDPAGHDTSKQLAAFAKDGLDYVLFDAAHLDAMAAEFALAYDGAEGRTSKKMRVFKLGSDAGKFEGAVLDSIEGSTSSTCGCEADSKRDAVTETRESPCCEEIAFVYSFSEWSEECGDDQTRYETESCAAADGCSCSGKRSPKKESRAGPCCASFLPLRIRQSIRIISIRVRYSCGRGQ